MGDSDRELPDDFAGRLRAARAYAGISSQKELAARLNVSGASASSLKVYESGSRKPPPLTATRFVAKLAATTGLSEAFFWGDDESDQSSQLDRIEANLTAIRERLDALLAPVSLEEAARQLGPRLLLAAQALRTEEEQEPRGADGQDRRPPSAANPA